MNSIKCPQCGLVNWATAATCRRCGMSLENLSPDALFSTPAAEQATQWMGTPFNQHITPQMSEAAAKTWRWFVIYCVLMAFVYLLCIVGGVAALLIDTSVMDKDANVELKFQGVVFLVSGLIFIIPYAIAPFLEKKPGVWIYGIVLIALGMTSCCFWPIVIPLLINWVKPETKLMFGKQ